MKKIRLVHIVPTLDPGGAERIVAHIVRGLDRSRYEPLVIALGRRTDGELDRSIEREGIAARYLGKPPGFDWRMYLSLHHDLKEYQPNIVHTHMQVLRYALPSVLSLRGVSWVHTVHNLAEHEIEPLARWIHRNAFRRGVVPIAVAEPVALSVRKLYRLDRCEVISNAIPTNLYGCPPTPRDEWRAREGFCGDDVLVVCVARFSPQKNHPLLLNAFAKGPACDPRAHLLLVGDGALREQLIGQAENLGLGARVHFLGLRTDIPDVLGASDVFVLSSDYEGNPLSVMEAMAGGLPIVCTDVGAVPDLIENGKQGLLVRPGEVRGLATAMEYFTGNRDSRLFYGAAAAQKAREKFDVATMVKSYEKLYENLIADPHRRGRASVLREATVPLNLL